MESMKMQIWIMQNGAETVSKAKVISYDLLESVACSKRMWTWRVMMRASAC